MEVTFRLMQESGVQGPQKTTTVYGDADLSLMAREWANVQTGHPWDVLTVETDEGDTFEVEL